MHIEKRKSNVGCNVNCHNHLTDCSRSQVVMYAKQVVISEV